MRTGSLAPTGDISMRVFKGGSFSNTPGRELSLFEIVKHALPWFGVSKEVAIYRLRNFPNVWRGLWRITMARWLKVPHFYGQLSLVKISNGRMIDYGLASMRVVTTAGVNAIVDAFQNTVELENFKYHGFGTGGTAEAVGDTALVTELTTQYNPDSTRPTGTTTEGASANIYRTVATLTPDAGGTIAVTEHGVFTATSAGTLLDRSLFTAVNIVASSDSLQATYDLTFTAGS